MGLMSREGNVCHALIGIDVGQAQDRTAIVVSDPALRGDKGEVCYPIRYVKALPLGISAPDIVSEIRSVCGNIRYPEGYTVKKHLWIEINGCGLPIYDMVREAVPDVDVHGVFMSYGEAKEKPNVWAKQITMAKAYMVSRLQILIDFDRIDAPDTPEVRQMIQELKNYEIRITESANAQFGAWKVGTHDDLVVALGLACLAERLKADPLGSLPGGGGNGPGVMQTYSGDHPEIQALMEDQRLEELRRGVNYNKPWLGEDYLERWLPNKKF